MYFYPLPKDYTEKTSPIPWEKLTKVKGDPMRHIEQLHDDVAQLKEEIKRLKERK